MISNYNQKDDYLIMVSILHHCRWFISLSRNRLRLTR